MSSIDNDDAVFQFDSTSPSMCNPDSAIHSEKGKGLSLPVPIPPPSLFDSPYDIFDLSSSLSNTDLSLSPSSSLSYGSFNSTFLPSNPDQYGSPSDATVRSSEKGKEREVAPSLPPFTFIPSGLGNHASWPSPAFTSSTPGPSSYNSFYGSPKVDDESALEQPADTQYILSRRRSFSASSEINVDSSSRQESASFTCSKDSRDNDLNRLSKVLDEHISFPVNDNELVLRPFLPPKCKARSNSSPYPLSALDIVSNTPDLYQPIVFIRPKSFDKKLPRELLLQILRTLVIVHEQDHITTQADVRWSLSKACSSKNKWTGRDRGVRELVKLSRVSKSWQSLVFDGELWTDIDLHALPSVPQSLILRMSGAFVTSLNVAGHASLSPVTLSSITEKLCIHVATEVPSTQLTTLNLHGCATLTTRSLHGLLMCSPLLSYLYLRGLSIVTNTTCDILASYCHNLISLDVGRCSNMDAEGIKALANAAIIRHEHLPLKALRLSGLKFVNDDTMASLARAAPYLETLDLSYACQLHNSALEAFVACDEEEEASSLGVSTLILNAREAGRDASDSSKYKRRRTRLRHLSLSFCTLLTDTACSNLAHSVPNLETLELAGIGEDLKDDGLIRLLSTTPVIRRIDLEDATDITDAVLTAITPSESPKEKSPDFMEPGAALEHLVISYASNISDDALLSLVRRCTRLRVLEADNTHMGTSVLKEFVQLNRKRSMANAKIVAVDCRGISEPVVKELSCMTRPRLGWRAYGARKLKYLDGRDGDLEDLKVGGQDECDEKRIVLKSFYSWQVVDTVTAARDKRHKRRKANDSNSSTESQSTRVMTMRWWSPGGRRSGNASPQTVDLNNEGCRIM